MRSDAGQPSAPTDQANDYEFVNCIPTPVAVAAGYLFQRLMRNYTNSLHDLVFPYPVLDIDNPKERRNTAVSSCNSRP
jgi:hypothetical protein